MRKLSASLVRRSKNVLVLTVIYNGVIRNDNATKAASQHAQIVCEKQKRAH
jgi:hypothetical protein